MSQIPSGVMYAQVEQISAIQDYGPRLICVRLVGIDEHSFRSFAFNKDNGCRTYFVDVAWESLQLTKFAIGTLLRLGRPLPSVVVRN
jgi:hypothetical protein